MIGRPASLGSPFMLVRRAEAGEEVVLTRHGHPAASKNTLKYDVDY